MWLLTQIIGRISLKRCQSLALMLWLYSRSYSLRTRLLNAGFGCMIKPAAKENLMFFPRQSPRGHVIIGNYNHAK